MALLKILAHYGGCLGFFLWEFLRGIRNLLNEGVAKLNCCLNFKAVENFFLDFLDKNLVFFDFKL